jgi:hypothetical protein
MVQPNTISPRTTTIDYVSVTSSKSTQIQEKIINFLLTESRAGDAKLR